MLVDFLPTVQLELIDPPPSYRAFVESRMAGHIGYPGYETRYRIVIRFTDRIDLGGALILNDDVFLDRQGKIALKDRTGGHFLFSFEELAGDRFEIVATRQTEPDSLIGYVLLGACQVFLQRSGLTLVHASSFQTDRYTVLLPAWAGTGKTNLLLAAIHRAAKVISDDLAVLDENGTLLPYYRPLAIYDYNCKWFPELRQKFNRHRSLWLVGSRVLDATAAVAARVVSDRSLALAALRKVAGLSKNVLAMYMTPEEIHAGSGFGVPAPVDAAIWLVKGEAGDITAQPQPLDRLAFAAGVCLEDELRFFMTAYRKYLFLTGGSRSRVEEIEGLSERSSELVRRGLESVPIRRMSIPADCDPSLLFNEIEAVVSSLTAD